MPEPPDLLLITWNRRPYVEKTLANLFADPADFRLYCWDNASKDGTADLIADLDDPRVVHREFSKENVMQREPCLWFFDKAKSQIIGKIDDDILLPHGWTSRIAPIIEREPTAGMLACWIFMPEDWDERIASHKIIELGDCRVFHNTWVAGQSFLARKELLKRFVIHAGYGFPVNQIAMTRAGFICGYPLPLMMAHNMDDPRSPHCLMNQPGGMGGHAALTARMRGFENPESYARWIASDAAAQLRDPIRLQLRRFHTPIWRRCLRRLKGMVVKPNGRQC